MFIIIGKDAKCPVYKQKKCWTRMIFGIHILDIAPIEEKGSPWYEFLLEKQIIGSIFNAQAVKLVTHCFFLE